jgi:hypothetical protein
MDDAAFCSGAFIMVGVQILIARCFHQHGSTDLRQRTGAAEDGHSYQADTHGAYHGDDRQPQPRTHVSNVSGRRQTNMSPG